MSVSLQLIWNQLILHFIRSSFELNGTSLTYCCITLREQHRFQLYNDPSKVPQATRNIILFEWGALGNASNFLSVKYVYLEEEDLWVLHISLKMATQCVFLTKQNDGTDSI